MATIKAGIYVGKDIPDLSKMSYGAETHINFKSNSKNYTNILFFTSYDGMIAYTSDTLYDVAFMTYDYESPPSSNVWASDEAYRTIEVLEDTDVGYSFYNLFFDCYESLKEYTLRIDGTEVTDYENVVVNGISYKCKKAGSEIPTDLTGYTVRISSGWSAISGYGIFNINFKVETDDSINEFGTLYIGYDDYYESENHICCKSTGGFVGAHNYSNRLGYRFHIIGGTDVTNPDLIDWFVDNGATFTKTN